MPSLQTVLRTTTSFLGLAGVSQAGHHKTCQNVKTLSCHNTTAIQNTCCTNTPGGLALQTQFWDFDPATGPKNSWTIHGLWPDNCDGTYQQYCDENRQYKNITEILQAFDKTVLLAAMNKYWKDDAGNDESFYEHEWGKHGTCFSTLDPDCYNSYKPTQEVVNYFERTVGLFATLPSYQFLANASITPSNTKNYTLSAVQAALKKGHGELPTIQCTDAGEINEIWYYYNTVGSIAQGRFIPAPATTPGDCPDSVRYVPKVPGTQPTPVSSTSSGSPTSSVASGTGSPTASPTATGAPFSGSGYLDVQVSGAQNGCLISDGTWYTTGTCATYTAASSGDGFTLTSSKGNCAVTADTKAISCSSNVTDATVFGHSDNFMTYSGSDEFYATTQAAGTTRQTVFPGTGAVDLKISWQSK